MASRVTFLGDREPATVGELSPRFDCFDLLASARIASLRKEKGVVEIITLYDPGSGESVDRPVDEKGYRPGQPSLSIRGHLA